MVCRDQAGQPLKCTYEGTLKELFIYFKPRNPRKIFYQRLAIPIHELENKKQFKATWMSADQKEEKELILYPNKNGRVDQVWPLTQFISVSFFLFRITDLSGGQNQ